MESRVSVATRQEALGADSDAGPALVVHDIAKTYGVVRALRGVSMEVGRGEVRALVGENGSGKSTFVGIVSGTVKPDRGRVIIAGVESVEHRPWEAQRHRALTVFQDGSVVPELTVAQNLYLGTPADQRPDYRQVEKWATECLAAFELGELRVGQRAGNLPPGDRQLVEIVRAIMARPAVLLLDEATSALDASAVDRALALMRAAADGGSAVLFVTHRLSEVFRVANRISVLRDGAFQGTYETGAIDQSGVVELMAGRSIDLTFPDRAEASDVGGVVLDVRGLAGRGYGPVDLSVRSGEIVGIGGANGNGQVELLRGLAGVDVAKGRVAVKGRAIPTYHEAVKMGVLLLSSDRRKESLLAPLGVRENLTVGVLAELSTAGLVRWPREKGLVTGSIQRFGIRVGSMETAVTALSGGNQQKVALGRVLAAEPKILVVDEPTLGLDAGSRIDIYRFLRDAANRGVAVVVVSSDATELAGLCDRVIVMSRGRIVAELPGQRATEEQIIHAFAGATHVGGTDDRPAELEPDSVPTARAPGIPQAVGRLLRRYETGPRLALLTFLMVILGVYAQTSTSNFLSKESLYNIFLLTVPLAAVAGAEFLVLFTRGIDVSVGAVMGVTIAVMSFVVTSASFAEGFFVSLGIALGVGIVVGLGNALLIEKVQISPVITTVGTLSIVSGIGLVLRPTAAGTLSPRLVAGLTAGVWAIPWALIGLAVLFVIADFGFRATGRGLRVRAVGLNPDFAYRLGINAPRTRQLSYIGCSSLAAIAGVLLAGQVGVGDSTVGSGYTLIAIAAPVLGGASLLGGYGTFVGCLLGALVLSVAQSLPSSLGVSTSVSFLLTGGLTLLALFIYTRSAGAAIRGYASATMRKMHINRARPETET